VCCQCKSFEEDDFEKAQAKAQAKRTHAMEKQAVTSLQPTATPLMIIGTPTKENPVVPNQAGSTGVTGEENIAVNVVDNDNRLT